MKAAQTTMYIHHIPLNQSNANITLAPLLIVETLLKKKDILNKIWRVEKKLMIPSITAPIKSR